MELVVSREVIGFIGSQWFLLSEENGREGDESSQGTWRLQRRSGFQVRQRITDVC